MKSPFESHTKQLVALLSALGLTGCDLSQNLNPPKNGESVQISVNVPNGFAPHDINVSYRSKTCIYSGISMGTGSKITRDGYQNLTITPEPQPESSFYTAKVPVDGGGICKWTLSNIRFGMAYKSTGQFGSNIDLGRPAAVTIRFDGAPFATGSSKEKNIEGDLTIKRAFYPWLREHFVGGHKKSINLIGQDGTSIKFYAPRTRNIIFEPTIHSEFIVYSIGNKEKIIGLYPEFTYPDGSKQRERLGHPNFQKLQSIRNQAEQARNQPDSP